MSSVVGGSSASQVDSEWYLRACKRVTSMDVKGESRECWHGDWKAVEPAKRGAPPEVDHACKAEGHEEADHEKHYRTRPPALPEGAWESRICRGQLCQ